MEDAALVVEGLAALADALLAGAQRAEVFNGLGHGLAVEVHDNAAGVDAVNVNVKVDLVRHLGLAFGHRGEMKIVKIDRQTNKRVRREGPME